LHARELGDEREVTYRYTEYYKWLVGDFDRDPPSPGLLLRYVERLLKQDGRLSEDAGMVAEELIQDCMTQHFAHITSERRIAAVQIHEKVPKLKLAYRGDLFQPQIKNWGKDMRNWTNDAMEFGSDGCEPANQCHQEAEQINRRWYPLRADGERLLKWLNGSTATRRDGEPSDDDESASFGNTESEFQDSPDQKVEEQARRTLKKLLGELSRLLEEEGPGEADQRAGCAGGARFAVDTGEIIDASSKVRIPMIGLLFWKAGRKVRDYFKSRDARLGASISSSGAEGRSDAEGDEFGQIHDVAESATARTHTLHAVTTNDDSELDDNTFDLAKSRAKMLQQEIILWCDVERLLYAPVREAEQKYATAQTADAEKKLKQQHALFELNLAVFGVWVECASKTHEGASQQDIADWLGTTRDKVRTRMAHITKLLAPLRSERQEA
jgi:hypothetical protein